MARILVVDDEESVREITCLILRRAGHVLESAGGAEEALVMLRQERFDLLITDITMPDVNGLELAKQAAKAGGGPVLLMSGGEAPPTLGRGMQFLRKPFRAEALVSEVEAILAEP